MKCPVCQSKKNSFIFFAYDILYKMVNDKFSIRHCHHCKALFISPFPSQKETEKYYPSSYYSYDVNESVGFFENLKKKIIKSKMENDFPLTLIEKVLVFIFQGKFSGIPLYRRESGKFLDIGCGNGKNLKVLKKYGWDAYGIELDKRAVEYARRQGLQVENSSIEEADFYGTKFDCIRIWHVFEHLTDPQTAIQKIRELLSDDGEILMAVPNAQSVACAIFGKYWYGLDVPRHVVSYSPRTLRYLAEKNGLEITEIRYASCGSFVGSISNFFRRKAGYTGNLINNMALILLFSPFDFMSDLFHRGDTIFIKMKRNG